MPEPRYRQVSIDDTPYYHCISRCVRRAFLCGSDPLTGFDFEHHRQWVVDRIKLLCSVYSVDLCAYANMSNHYHIVVRINTDEVKQWSDEDDTPSFGALGPVSMLKAFAKLIGRSLVKGHAIGNIICPERV